MNLSLYQSKESKENKTITLDNYVDIVREGYYSQDAVITARAIKEKMLTETNEAKRKELEKKYKAIKDNAQVVTPSGTIISGEKKTMENVKLNGLICIDIDYELTESQINNLYNDEYTRVVHRSFTTGWCVFYEINPDKFDNAYYSISEYLFNKYDIKTDPSGKNVNRLRFVSYSPEIGYFPKSNKFPVKARKKEIKPINFLHTEDSFDYILEQIRDRGIDLCQEDYDRYLKIGMSIASHFGESGRYNYHAICRYGGKYKEKDCDRDYTGFVRATSNGSGNKDISIATFYWLAKEQGLDLYTPKTKEIVHRIKVGRASGNPTVESITENMEVLGYEINEKDKEQIKVLLDSKEDFSNVVNEELSEIEQVGNFIRDVYIPTKDEITKYKYINGVRMSDSVVDDIYINCLKNFREFKVKKDDIRSILNSSYYVQSYNILTEFLEKYKDIETNNAIQRVVDCIETEDDVNREYVAWAFKKWIVSALHNWTADEWDEIVSPLVLVLASNRHGSGKTYFFRTLLPKEFDAYVTEGKIDIDNKDSKLRLARSILMIDDEMSGMNGKDALRFKSMADTNIITERVPYGREDETFKRRAILAGTSNELNLLKDPTGKQRRILPINIKSVNHEKFQKIDKKELIIEAFRELQNGFDWKIFKESDIDYLYQNTQDNLDSMPMEDIFLEHFRFEEEDGYRTKVVMNQGELLKFFMTYTVFKNITKYQIQDVMLKNGMGVQKPTYCPQTKKTRKGYPLYVRQIIDENPF